MCMLYSKLFIFFKTIGKFSKKYSEIFNNYLKFSILCKIIRNYINLSLLSFICITQKKF